MSTESIQGQRSYWCFISYRHADNSEPGRQWATWLHQAIETYEVPRELVGVQNERGETIPERIFPVFRDEEELPADADLASPVYRALRNSKFLIVICSPRARESIYVANEIKYFKQIGRDDRVLALMIEGEPNVAGKEDKQSEGTSALQECFPEPLRHRVDSEGNLLPDRVEPIAADFRLNNGTQGWTSPEAYRLALKQTNQLNAQAINRAVAEYQKRCELMKLKIIAGILGVELGNLTRRDAAFQLAIARKRAKALRRWLMAVGLLAILAIAGGAFAVRKQQEAEFERDQTTQAHIRLLTEAASGRLRERDVRMAQGIILEVLSQRRSEHPDADTTAIFQEARAADLQLAGLSGHKGAVNSALYSPDGKRVVTASSDNTARIWDLDSGAQIVLLEGHTAEVLFASYSPDANQVITASADQTARIWDANTGKQLGVLSGHAASINSAIYSPDGQKIVTASSDRTARVWDAKTFQQSLTLSGHEGIVSSATFSPDGTHILTASADKTARIWDAHTGAQIKVLTGHSENVLCAAYSPDGKRVVTASQDKTAKIWDANTGVAVSLLYGHLGTVRSAAYSPDGRWIITSSYDRTARIWNADTAVQYRILSGHLANILSAAYSPDGNRIVTASDDQTARIWYATAASQLAMLSGHTELVSSASYSPDGSRVITTSGDKSVRIWDVATATQVGSLNGHNGLVNSALYSPDGSRIVTACYDKFARVWDSHSFKELMSLAGHADFVTWATYSPDARRIATASFDKTVRIWDASTATTVTTLTGHRDVIRSVMFSPDNTRVVTASDDKTARIWDVATGKQLIVLSGHGEAVRSASFSPDGTRVVTAANDRTARIWNSATGKLVRILTGHRDALRSANYSPDGHYIVTASYDKTARIWDANDGVQLAVLPVQGDGVRSAAYSPTGDRIIAASLDTTATIWDARIPADLDTQIKWMAAAQFDPLSTDERFQLGLPTTPGLPNSSIIDDEQLKAAKSGDLTRAVASYEKAWAQGRQRAAFELGRLYEFGGFDRAHPIANVDLNKAWIWYQKGADAGEPFSLARLAQREELAAVSEQSTSRKNALLLSAFAYYAAASRRAELESWPDENWRDWRFRRATLARLSARSGLMKEIADRYTKVVERWTAQPMTRFERFRRWLNI